MDACHCPVSEADLGVAWPAASRQRRGQIPRSSLPAQPAMPKAVIAAVLACSAVAGAAHGAPPDEAGIRANVAAYETAWNARDVAGVLATFTPDADVVAFDGPRDAGREAIRARLREDLAAAPPTMRISLTVTSIRPLTPESAIVDTVARFNEGAVRENRGTSVFVRRDGQWLVSALRVFPAQRP